MCKNYVEVSGRVEAMLHPNHLIINSDDEIIYCRCEDGLPNIGDNIIITGCLQSRMCRLYGKNIVLTEVKGKFRNVD